MNPDLVEIAYILDRSGSMEPLREAAIAAFNQFVKSQRDAPGRARLTLVQFDDAYEVPVPAAELPLVPELTAATYVPRGSTALLDAIGRTLQETNRRLQAQPETEKPAKVIFAIFTDGQENASRQYTQAHISDLIRLYRDEKGWEFLFLAANQDAIATAAALHMDTHLSGTVSSSPTGVKSTAAAFSRKVRSMRLRSSAMMDTTALEDEAKSMSEIVQEEERQAQDR